MRKQNQNEHLACLFYTNNVKVVKNVLSVRMQNLQFWLILYHNCLQQQSKAVNNFFFIDMCKICNALQ